MSFWETVEQLAQWAHEHREEIEITGRWGLLIKVCGDTHLYAPEDDVWAEIVGASTEDRGTADLRSLILALYGPAGAGFGALCDELRSAPALQSRQREVGQVIESLVDGRHYVAICGALPLVEGLLADSHGSWKKMHDYRVLQRLDESGALTAEVEAEMLLNGSAVLMVEYSLPTVWESKRMDPGVVSNELNRNWALHGTARDWDTPENAVRALLLVAATARIVGPLLANTAPPT